MNKNFLNHLIDAAYINLHDCRADKLEIYEKSLTLCFPDGFWVNENSNILRSKVSEVTFKFEEVEIYLFEKNNSGECVRKEIAIEKLAHYVNNQACQLEFLYDYTNASDHLFECVLWSDKFSTNECHLKLYDAEIHYCWNELNPMAVW